MKVALAVLRTATLDNVRDGYQLTDQYPLSFDMAIRRVNSQLPIKSLDAMREKIDDVVQLFRDRGVVTEDDHDNLGIVQSGDSRLTPRDERALYQQRAVLMNSQA